MKFTCDLQGAGLQSGRFNSLKPLGFLFTRRSNTMPEGGCSFIVTLSENDYSDDGRPWFPGSSSSVTGGRSFVPAHCLSPCTLV